MAIKKSSFNTFILLFLTTVNVSNCLYEDQIGKFDWKKSYVGKLKFAAFDSVKRVVVASEQNALASLNLKNGQIVWRQLLESPDTHQIELLHVDSEVLTVSGNGNLYYVRGWDLNTGTITFEWSLQTERTGGKWFVNHNQLVHVIPVANSHLEVTHYEVKTGLNKGTTSRLSTPWIGDLSNCVLAGTYWTCLSAPSSSATLYYVNLVADMNKVNTWSLSSLMGDVSGAVSLHEIQHSEPAVLLQRNAVYRLVVLGGDTPKILPYSLEASVISVKNGDQNLLMHLMQTASKDTLLKTIDIDSQETNEMPVEVDSHPGHQLVTGICRGANCRILYTSSDDSVSLLQLPSGKIQWQRDEALAGVITADFVELPLSDLDASIEREFNEASSQDIVGMFIKRIVSQTRQLSSFLNGKETSKENHLVRDDFGLHKLMVLVSKVGKIFALDTLSGELVWSKHVQNIEPFSSLGKETFLLYQQRTARYLPHSPQMTLIGKHPGSGQVLLYVFDPITGKELQPLTSLNFKLKQSMLLPYEDHTHLKGIVLLSDKDELHIYPESATKVLAEQASTTYLFNADVERSVIKGYSLLFGNEEAAKATSTWELNLAGSKLVALSVRPPNERVHSQGRVLADRSVFYKYVNPNLIAVATISDDPMHRHVLSVYLVDGVTGLVVYATHHKRANGPVQMIHSENWVVYSYFNERYRRFEMTAVELYEGSRQSNSTTFSSLALSQLPHPETLSYILPVQPLTMVATLTERGITNKHVLMGLTLGSVLEMPWAFLEPRGAHMPSNPEEGYIPYMPELPIQTENFINYNQTLGRIRGIQVSPAKLESTCLVVVYGLDLFYTRVTPSKTFDVLKEDFDHGLIVMVLAGLTLASYVTKRLSARKALKQAWK